MTKRDELIALGGVGVKVRELEWPPRCPRGQRVHNRPALVNYTVAHYGGDVGDAIYRWAEAHSPWSDPLPTYEAAKAAAQSDYETRITSALITAPQDDVREAFQSRVRPWMLACFGPVIPFDKTERNHRFLEEALELVQSIGCTQSEAHQLVDYVFGRPIGDPMQEAGGVMVTLAALCLANDLDMAAAGETELARIWTKVEAIRAKQAAKPKHSPLPGPSDPTPSRPDVSVEELVDNLQDVVDEIRSQNWKCGGAHLHDDDEAAQILARALKAKYHMEGR